MSELDKCSGYIDSHFHVREMSRKGLDPAAELESALELGVTGGMDVAVDLEDIGMRETIAKSFRSFASTLGLSPYSAESDGYENGIRELAVLVEKHQPAAIGEIGLDWHWNYGTREKQIDLFKKQLTLADTYRLPVVIHNRNADEDMIDILSKNPPSEGGIMHCFSSGYDEAVQYFDLGFKISFAGNTTYKKSDGIQEAARRLPPEALLFETDSPYLSPAPVRGTVNTPRNVRYVYAFVAQLRGVTVRECIDTAARNYSEVIKRDLQSTES